MAWMFSGGVSRGTSQPELRMNPPGPAFRISSQLLR
jgi:hypothetical protein